MLPGLFPHLLKGVSRYPGSALQPASTAPRSVHIPKELRLLPFGNTASSLPAIRKLLPLIGVPVMEAPCFQDQHTAVANVVQVDRGSLGQEGSPVLGCGDRGQPSGREPEGNGG